MLASAAKRKFVPFECARQQLLEPLRLFTVTAAGMDVDSRAAPEKGFKSFPRLQGRCWKGLCRRNPPRFTLR